MFRTQIGPVILPEDMVEYLNDQGKAERHLV